jgi:steroid delta-isomerase-like uncharacterized protein
MMMPDRLDHRMRLVDEHVQAENAHDLDRIMTTFGEQAHYDDQPWDEHHQGPGGVQAYYMRLLSALPDLHIAIERRHVTQDDVILEVTITGTHRGEWRGLPATGRRVRIPLCGVFTFDDAGKWKRNPVRSADKIGIDQSPDRVDYGRTYDQPYS